MSKFKDLVLDFNIYTESTVPSRRPRRATSSAVLTLAPLPTPEKPPVSFGARPEPASGSPKKTPKKQSFGVETNTTNKTKKTNNPEKSAKEGGRKKCTKRRCSVSRRRLLLLVLVACVIACLWLLSLLFDRANVVGGKHTLSRCVRHKSSVSCQNKACSGFRGTCASGRVVVFDSYDCADRIQTMHVEQPDGRLQRLPAAYFRVENSSMFVFHGKRVSFQPAACGGRVETAVVHPGGGVSRLYGHIVWTYRLASPEHRFKIYEGHKDTRILLAELDGTFVRTLCNADHCVYQFPIHCASVDPSALRVYCEHEGKDTVVPPLVFCGA